MIIPGYERYEITEDGVVTDLDTCREIKGYIITTRGYRYRVVSLIDENCERKIVSVLRLLALTYLKKPNCVCIARAKDGDNTNAVLSNVAWVPCCDSTQIAWNTGKMTGRKKREKCYNEGTVALVYDTLQTLGEPTTTAELCRILDLPYSAVRYSAQVLIGQKKIHRIKEGLTLL